MSGARVIVQLDQGFVSVSLADGEEMRRALARHYEREEAPDAELVTVQLRSSEPFVDPDGTLRVGRWLLEGRRNNLVLTRREREGDHFTIDVARLSKTPEGGWAVTRVDREQVPLR